MCVCVCVCVCVSVKSHLKICRVFSETASFKSYGVICLPMAPYSDIAAVFCATFRRQSFLKLLTRLTELPRILLNVRQRASFSLVSVFCSQTFRILFVTRISVARALFRIRARVAPRVLHFSAFILLLRQPPTLQVECR